MGVWADAGDDRWHRRMTEREPTKRVLARQEVLIAESNKAASKA